MKFNINKQKISDSLTTLAQNATESGKKIAESTKSSVTNIIEKSKTESLARKLKKYNPIFPEQYASSEFTLPNMICIVDDAVRRHIEICKGAIGWLSTDANVEILHLYDEAVPLSGLQFIPTPTCDAVYYVDNFDRKRFIRVDCIFSKAHEEKLAELKHIAHSLGAKRCEIEISESKSSTDMRSRKANLNETAKDSLLSEEFEQSYARNNCDKRSGQNIAEFEGSSNPTRPNLKWFANEDTILRLIDARCSGNNTLKKDTLKLSGSSSATMSQKTAYAIDAAVKEISGVQGEVSMGSLAQSEQQSSLLFHIEF